MPSLNALNKSRFILTIVFYIAILVLYGFWANYHHKKEILDNIDATLYNGAISLKYLLPADFHDRAVDEKAISIDEDKYIAHKLTRLVKESGFKYAYTIIKKDGKLFFAACDLIADPENERGTFYYYEYKDADVSFFKAFEKKTPTYKTLTDQWGTVRSVIVPETSPGGTQYLACVDYNITYVKGLLHKNLFVSIATVLFFLIPVIPITKAFIRSYQEYSKNLKESETKFRTLAETSPIAIAILRWDHYLFVNSSWENLTGYTKEDAKKLNPLMTVHPDMREQVKKNAENRLNYQDVQTRYEMKGITKKGDVVWYDFTAILFEYDNAPAILSFMPDLTDRKKAEQEREENIEKLKDALDEINTLKGIVPICASCKKIRDDQGYWNRLESYIQKHSKAEFSHGLCPECSDKFYGDKDWYIKMKKKKE